MPFALTSAALLTLLLGGCDDEPPVDDTPVDTGLSDADGDSWTVAGGDCDDTDPSIHPGVDERCNGRDDDCDGSVDEDDAVDATAWYADADGDEYGDPATLSVGCTSPEAYIADGTDCDDADPSIHPGAEEVVADGVDQDCDGGELCYQDTDWDGYGTSVTVASPDLDCADPGEAQFYTDCDDGDALVHPGAAEDCNGRDDDCSGGPAPEESDADADGWMGCEGDCDDGDPSVYPSAFETVADGVDQDCDGGDVCYDDADGDGYGSAVTVVSADLDCADSGESSVSMDCDDAHADIHPDTAETCDGEDDDCDGEVDERDAVDATTWYADTDGDGYGDPEVTHTSCEAPTGYVADATDCDDSDPGVHPDAEEIVADGVDQDCDGTETCYLDFDRDGYGTSSLRDSSDLDCTGERESSVDTDCDDGDGGVHPGATERCDGDDDDCDGTTDEDDATDAATWYADADGDGYGDPAVTHVSCEAPPGYVAPGTDCDDADPGVHPDAMETCDDEDDDCDGTVDEACEDCGNGIDDDEDGLLDCEDGDCAGGEPCLETLCDDGEDGDDDGLADCDDDDCWGPGCHPAGARARVRSGRFEEVAVRAIERSRRTCEVVEVWEDDVEQRRVILHSVRGTVQVLPPGLVSWSATTARTTCAWSIASVSFGTTGRRLTWTAFGLGSGGRLYEDHPGQPVRNSLYVEPGCRLAADPWFLPTSVLALERRDSRIHVVGTFDTLRLWSSWGRLGIASAFGPLWYLENRTVSTTETSTWSATLPYSVMCGTDYRYGTTTTWHASGSLASGSVHSALP